MIALVTERFSLRALAQFLLGGGKVIFAAPTEGDERSNRANIHALSGESGTLILMGDPKTRTAMTDPQMGWHIAKLVPQLQGDKSVQMLLDGPPELNTYLAHSGEREALSEWATAATTELDQQLEARTDAKNTLVVCGNPLLMAALAEHVCEVMDEDTDTGQIAQTPLTNGRCIVMKAVKIGNEMNLFASHHPKLTTSVAA